MKKPLFSSFFMAGYECADHLNCYGNRVNLLQLTQHDVQVRNDYRILKQLGIATVREGICWSAVETQPYRYNFNEAERRIAAAEEYGIQQIWDLCHFGFPDDIYPTHPHFTKRFVALCKAFCEVYKNCSNQRLLVVPINEISFLAWLGGEAKGTAPFAVNSGYEVKYQLCKAAIAGIKEIKNCLPDAVVLTSEPLIKVHAENEREQAAADGYNEYQYQATDMLLGRMCAELGGGEEYVDVLGQNYYPNCQWLLNGQQLEWPELTQKRIPLTGLLLQTHQRYNKPLWLSETSGTDIKRGPWLREIALACRDVMAKGVEMHGICIYPIINRPDWDHPDQLHHSGLWDCLPGGERVLDKAYYEVIYDLMHGLGLQPYSAPDPRIVEEPAMPA